MEKDLPWAWFVVILQIQAISCYQFWEERVWFFTVISVMREKRLAIILFASHIVWGKIKIDLIKIRRIWIQKNRRIKSKRKICSKMLNLVIRRSSNHFPKNNSSNPSLSMMKMPVLFWFSVLLWDVEAIRVWLPVSLEIESVYYNCVFFWSEIKRECI